MAVRSATWRAIVAAVGIAVVLTMERQPITPWWAVPLGVAGVGAVALATAWTSGLAGRGVTSGWLAAVVVGLFLGVPENDHLIALVPVLLALWLAELTGRAFVDGPLIIAIVVVLTWAGFYGAANRPASLVIGLGLAGLLATWPLVVLWPGERPGVLARGRSQDWALIALQGAGAFAVARWTPLGGGAAPAAAAVAVTQLTVVAAARLVVGAPDRLTR